jgi:hypothetical protein
VREHGDMKGLKMSIPRTPPEKHPDEHATGASPGGVQDPPAACPFRAICPTCGSSVLWAYDPTASAVLDRLLDLHDRVCAIQQTLEGVLP